MKFKIYLLFATAFVALNSQSASAQPHEEAKSIARSLPVVYEAEFIGSRLDIVDRVKKLTSALHETSVPVPEFFIEEFEKFRVTFDAYSKGKLSITGRTPEIATDKMVSKLVGPANNIREMAIDLGLEVMITTHALCLAQKVGEFSVFKRLSLDSSRFKMLSRLVPNLVEAFDYLEAELNDANERSAATCDTLEETRASLLLSRSEAEKVQAKLALALKVKAKEINDLEAQLRETSLSLKGAESTNLATSEELAETQAHLQSIEQEAAAVRARLTEKLRDAEAMIYEEQESHAETSHALRKAKGDIASLRLERAKRQARLEEAEASNTMLIGQVSEAEAKHRKASDELARVNAEADQLIRERDGLAVEQVKMLSRVALLEESLRRALVKGDQNESQWRQAEEQAESYLAELMDISCKNSGLVRKIERLERVKQSDRSLLSALKSDLHQSRNKLRLREALLLQKKQELASLRADFEHDLRESQRELELQSNAAYEAHRDLAESSRRVVELEAALEDAVGRAENFERQCAYLQERVNQLLTRYVSPNVAGSSSDRSPAIMYTDELPPEDESPSELTPSSAIGSAPPPVISAPPRRRHTGWTTSDSDSFDDLVLN